jgi:cation diffusion facilitator family transporter
MGVGKPMTRPRLSPAHYAWLSIAASLLTMGLKGGAYWVTGSVGLLSDAIESFINLAAGVMALAMITVASRPPDEGHQYGHGKAEYFSSGLEGGLILAAALSIAAAAVNRLLNPQPLEQIGLGMAISGLAALINLAVARVLYRAGRRFHSITLEADAQHLMTDVWTSAGVLLGVGAIALTGWHVLDPLIALLVAANILRVGLGLLRRSVGGLMDAALPAEEQDRVRQILDGYAGQGVHYHALRTRQAAARRFVSFHVLVPGGWSVRRGHELLKQMETEIQAALKNTTIFTHIEPLEDPDAWQDQEMEQVL